MRTFRVARGLLGVLLAPAASLVVPAAARADNCSGLADCSAGLKVALLVLAIVVAVLAVWLALSLVAEIAAARAAQAAAVAAARAAAARGVGGAVARTAAADAATAAAERQSIVETYQLLARGVNPTGSATNCGPVSVAFDQRLAGNLAAQAGPSGLTSTSTLEAHYGNAFREMFLRDIQTHLAANPGSRGIVFVEWTGAPYGHYFNVVNEGGHVFWIDAQPAIPRVAGSALEVLGAEARDIFTTLFLPTI